MKSQIPNSAFAVDADWLLPRPFVKMKHPTKLCEYPCSHYRVLDFKFHSEKLFVEFRFG